MDIFLIIVLVLVGLTTWAISYIWTALALGGVARKAGHPAWAGWVPVYNVIVLFRIAGVTPKWFFLGIGGSLAASLLGYLVPLVGYLIMNGLSSYEAYQAGGVFLSILGVVLTLAFWAGYVVAVVFLYRAFHRINRNFGQGGGMTVLAIFFPVIWLSILAWGPAQWLGVVPAPARPEAAAIAPTTGLVVPPPPAPPAPPAPASPPARSAVVPPPPPPPPPAAPTVAAIPGTPPPPPPLPAVPPVRSERPGLITESPWAPKSAAGAAPLPSVTPEPADDAERWAAPESRPARSARSAAPAPEEPDERTVAAPLRRPVVEDEDDDLDDRTTVAPRRSTPLWSLVLEDGTRLPLTGERVLLGRKPAAHPDYPGAQLLPVPDPTKTMSKNHALLERSGDAWTLVDLASTNGVATIEAGVETVLDPGVAVPVPGEFALGRAKMAIQVEGRR